MKWGNWLAARRGLALVIGLVLAGTGGYASVALAANKMERGRLAVTWPASGFPGYTVVVSGRATGWRSEELVVLERKERRRWRRVAHARPNRAGGFAISWKAPKTVGPLPLRLVVVRRSRVLAQRSARLRIRPLPIAIPARDVLSVPAPGHAGWIRFKAPNARSAHAASAAAGCVPIPAGAQLYGGINNNFVSVGYNAQTARHGFLGKINFAKCGTAGGQLYATPVTLNQAYPGAPLDLAAGFTDVADASKSATAQRNFAKPVAGIPCTGGGSGTLTGSVSLGFSPTFKASFAGLSLSSAAFAVTGTASATLGVHGNANAGCTAAQPLIPKTRIATVQGQVGPFWVVVDLEGELDLSGSIYASASVSDDISATATVTGGVKYANGNFAPIKGTTFNVVNTGPNVSATATASATLTPKIWALVYGALGPEVDLNAGLRVKADSTAAHCWLFDAPVSVDAAFDGFGKTWAKHEFDVYDKEISQSPGPCAGSATVSVREPGNQTSTVNSPAALQMQAGDTDGGALTYSATGLPAGLSINPSTGLIAGTPTAAGASSVTVTAKDASGPSSSASFTWTINLGPTSLGPATSISSGADETCAVLSSSRVACWGTNDGGQLGDGTTGGYSNLPVLVTGITNATSVTVGPGETCAVLATGGVDCWGANGVGQLGNGTTGGVSNVPVAVSGLSNAKAVTIGAGDSLVCALTTSGGVDCWGGDNTFGELGDGNDQPSNVPVPVSGISNAIALANAGAPGNPTAGDACALLATGTVECWGRHAGTNSDGTIASSYVPEPVTGMSSATALTAGGYYTCAAISSGSVSCKDIETNPATYTSFPIQATSVVASTTEAYYACAVLSSGGVDCWGQNYTGQLGDGTTTSSSSPVQASGVTGAKALAIGLAYTVASWGNHTCAVLTSGGVDCWGYNGYGELGNGTSGPGHDSSVPVSVSGLSGAVAVTATYSEFSTGGGTTCALLTDGAVDCWGANNYGQLGDGATGSSSSTPVRVTGLG